MAKDKANDQPEADATPREKDMATEIARLNERIDAAVEAGQLAAEIPGEYRLDGYETPNGEFLSCVIKFKPGKKYVIAFGNRVSTEVLLKVANGKELTAQEVNNNQALMKAGQSGCQALLQKWITTGANHFVFI